MLKNTKRGVLSTIILAMGAAGPITVRAQQTAAQPDEQIETIVVTAQKREELSQSVPISLTVLSRKDLEERHAVTLGDVSRFTPNLTFQSAGGINGASSASSVYIRGVGDNSMQITDDPAVGIYIDGVYFGRLLGMNLDLVDPERIEVLRGPQGTLFGKNTLGGAISVVSQAPTGKFGGYFQAEGGNYAQRTFKGSLEFPITEKLAANLSVAKINHDGYEKSLITGQALNTQDTFGVRAAVRWTPTDTLKLDLTSDYTRERGSEAALHMTAFNNSPSSLVSFYNAFVGKFSPYGPLDQRWISAGQRYNYATAPLGGQAGNDLDLGGVAVNAEWQAAPSVTVTSITAYRAMSNFAGDDFDGTPLDYLYSQTTTHQNQFSEELRAAGDVFDSRLKWLTGGYFSRENAKELFDINLGTGLAPYGLDLSPRQHTRERNSSYAVFTQEMLGITDNIDLTAGVRYSYEAKDVSIDAFNRVSGTVVLPPGTEASASWSSTTPKVSMDYKPTETILLYLSYSVGFKSGGLPHVFTAPTTFLPYNPETVNAYEAGFKTDWLHNRLRINGSLFTSSYKDLQIQATVAPGHAPCPSTTPGFCNLVVNAAKVRIRGGELEVTAVPASGFNVTVGLGHIENKFVEIDPALVASDVLRYSAKLPKTPKWTFNVGVQYDVPVMDLGTLTMRGDYSYRTRVFNDFVNDVSTSQGGLGLVNARLLFIPANRRWEFAFAGQNLADNVYITNGAAYYKSLGFNVVAYGAPRTMTASVKYRFGG
jgi:iron complex outermembrane receptor protein